MFSARFYRTDDGSERLEFRLGHRLDRPEVPPDDDLRKVLRSPASHQGVQQPVLDPAGRPSRLQPRVGRQQRHRLRTVRQLPQELQVQVLVEAFGAVPFPPNPTFPINIFLSERSRPALIQSSSHSTEQPSFFF